MGSFINVQGKWVRRSGSVGGGKYVLVAGQPMAKLPVGGVVANPPSIGGAIFEGDVAEYDLATKSIKHMRVFEVHTAVTITDTVVKVKRGDFYHKLEKGMVLCTVPSALDGAVTGITVGDVTVGSDFYSFTITAEDFGALAKGDLLLEAVGAGVSELVVKNPNAIFETDIYIDDIPATDSNDYEGARFPASLLNVATIYGSKASPMPAIVKENLRKGFSDIKVFE